MAKNRAVAIATACTFAAAPLAAHNLAAAQTPNRSVECAVGHTSMPPVATSEQANYRRQLHSQATGAGVRVAVIDTGVAPSPELGQVANGPDLVVPDSPNSLEDCDVHGTAVAGVIASRTAGIAPDATLISIRQTSSHYRVDDAAAGTISSLAKAVHAAVDAGARVINISVVSCLPPVFAQQSNLPELDAALNRAEESGAVVVAAAGNYSSQCQHGDVVIPSSRPTVLGVSALGSPGQRAEYAAPGELSGPGTVPVALSPQGWADGTFAPSDARVSVSPFVGTSFAAPHVSATVALLAQKYPTASPAQLRELLRSTAEPSTGYIDPLRAVEAVPSWSTATTQARVITAAAQAPADNSYRARSLALLGAGVAIIMATLLFYPLLHPVLPVAYARFKRRRGRRPRG